MPRLAHAAEGMMGRVSREGRVSVGNIMPKEAHMAEGMCRMVGSKSWGVVWVPFGSPRIPAT